MSDGDEEAQPEEREPEAILGAERIALQDDEDGNARELDDSE